MVLGDKQSFLRRVPFGGCLQISGLLPNHPKKKTPFPDARWDWPIYLQNWVVWGVNVGKYTSPIEHLELCTGRKQAGNFPGNNLAGIRYWKNYVLS